MRRRVVDSRVRFHNKRGDSIYHVWLQARGEHASTSRSIDRFKISVTRKQEGSNINGTQRGYSSRSTKHWLTTREYASSVAFFFSATVNNAPQHGVATSTQETLERHIHNRIPRTTSHDTLNKQKKLKTPCGAQHCGKTHTARTGLKYFAEWLEHADRTFNNTTRRTLSGFRSLKDPAG